MTNLRPTQDDLDALEEGWPAPSGTPAEDVLVEYKPMEDPWGEEEEGRDPLADLIAAGNSRRRD